MPAEFGKRSVETTGVVGSPACIFMMESILLVPDQRLGEKQQDQMEEAKQAR